RSFSPSMTRTCTRMVSPGAKPWRSFLRCPASTSRIASMTVALQIVGGLPPFESLYETPLVVRQPGLREEVRAALPRQPQRLPAAPSRDPRMIAGQQHRGYPCTQELLGPRVLRRLEQPARERLPRRGVLAPERTRQEPRDGIGHHEGR